MESQATHLNLAVKENWIFRRVQEADAVDSLQELLALIAEHKLAQGNLRGLFHTFVGRKISKANGTPVSTGLTWRELSSLLRRVRWDAESVRELGVNLDDLPPRDRERFWYSAITRANIDSEEASQLADKLGEKLKKHGYQVHPPGGSKAK